MYLLFINKSCSENDIICQRTNLKPTYTIKLNTFNYVILDEEVPEEIKDHQKVLNIVKNLTTLKKAKYFIIGFEEFFFDPSTITIIASNLWNNEKAFIHNSLFYLIKLLLLRYSFIYELPGIYLNSISYINGEKINPLWLYFDKCKINNIVDHFVVSKNNNIYKIYEDDLNSGLIRFKLLNGQSSFSLLLDKVLRGLEGCVGGSS